MFEAIVFSISIILASLQRPDTNSVQGYPNITLIVINVLWAIVLFYGTVWFRLPKDSDDDFIGLIRGFVVTLRSGYLIMFHLIGIALVFALKAARPDLVFYTPVYWLLGFTAAHAIGLVIRQFRTIEYEDETNNE